MFVQVISGKPGHTGLKRVTKAVGFSFKGLKAAFINEAAIRQELALIAILTPICLYLNISIIEKIILIGVLVNVLIVELINSAIEAVVDRVGAEFHELSGRAKDIGSAAVFVAISFAAVTWIGVLVFS